MISNARLLEDLRAPQSDARSHWHQAMRLVMSLKTKPDSADADWQSADLEVDDTPVAPAEWQAWLRTNPPTVGWMIRLLEDDVRREGVPNYEDVVRFVVDADLPVARAFLSLQSPGRRRLADALGARLGLAAKGQGSLDLDQANILLIGGWLSGRMDQKQPVSHYALRQLHERLEVLTGPLAELYPALIVKMLKSVRKGDLESLSIRSDWLDVPALIAVIKAIKAKPPNLEAVMGMLVEQGSDQGLAAIAEFLPDKKIGELALFWLAVSSRRGVEAAVARWAGVKGVKGARANELVARLEPLPSFDPPIAGPRVRLRSDLSAWGHADREPLSSSSAAPALSRDEMIAMCAGWSAPKASRRDLTAAQWADYLQVASLDPQLTHVGPSWDLARARGWLGRADEQASLRAAARRMSFVGRAHWNRSSKIEHGHLFLWAGADALTYVTAVVCALRVGARRRTMGWIDTRWIAPLKRVAWRSEVVDWLDRISQGRPLLGPVVERPQGPSVEWNPRSRDLFGSIPPGGSARLVVGEQTVEVYPAQGRLSLVGPVDGERQFPPTDRPITVGLVTHNRRIGFVIGSIVWGWLGDSADRGAAGGLVDIELRSVQSSHWRALSLLLRADSRGPARLARIGGDSAAALLALCAHLRGDLLAEAVAGAIGELGDDMAPYAALLGHAIAAPALPMRDLAACRGALQTKTGSSLEDKHGWFWARGHGQRDGGFVGPALTLWREASLPSMEELIELCSDCPIYPYRGEILDSSVRDTIGMRIATWRFIPEEGGFGDGPLFYQMRAIAWPVKEGVAVAVYSSFDVESVHWLIGLPYVPAT